MTDHEAKPKHRLAAIMATDVVGYSKLMQSDEAKALYARYDPAGDDGSDQTTPGADRQHGGR